jgi:hypothetical protein
MSLEHEILQLIQSSSESGNEKETTKINHAKAVEMVKEKLVDCASKNHVEEEMMARGVGG